MHQFVFLDTVVYPGGSLVNRNTIKTSNGSAWLTIPVRTTGRSGQLIGEVEIDNVHKWTNRHLATLRSNYGRAPYFRDIMTLLEPHYRVVPEDRRLLADFNIGVIRSIVSYLGINTQLVRGRELNVSGHRNDLNLDICRALAARTYLAGTGSKSYQDDMRFEQAGINPLYSPFVQEIYPQLFGEFVGNLSIVDVLMNCGCQGTRRLLGLER